ncbi:CHAT domain-containing protein [Mycena metata]|uniref:CHAT domain-containing protein n=1 Tax=Mycena metata TaxID=1033252 RepID=A0AAD7HZC1_9AGAR|nr:CHAT domain-containing protein [Mycena metata]
MVPSDINPSPPLLVITDPAGNDGEQVSLCLRVVGATDLQLPSQYATLPVQCSVEVDGYAPAWAMSVVSSSGQLSWGVDFPVTVKKTADITLQLWTAEKELLATTKTTIHDLLDLRGIIKLELTFCISTVGEVSNFGTVILEVEQTREESFATRPTPNTPDNIQGPAYLEAAIPVDSVVGESHIHDLNTLPPSSTFANVDNEIKHFSEVLALQPHGHPDRAHSLSRLGSALGRRSAQSQDDADLDNCISHLTEALELLSHQDPRRHPTIHNLGGTLWTRFQRHNNFADMDDAIRCFSEAHILLTPDNPACIHSLLRLGFLLTYRGKGVLADLDNGINYLREALNLLTPDNPLYMDSLGRLGCALTSRFHQEDGVLAHLDNGIDYLHQAVALLPVGNPNRAHLLMYLAHALGARFEQFRDQDRDKEQEIPLITEEHMTNWAKHNDRGSGTGWRQLYKVKIGWPWQRVWYGNPADLDDAVEHLHEALNITAQDHPDFAQALQTLGHVLILRFEQSNKFADLQNAIIYLQKAKTLYLMSSNNPRAEKVNKKLAMAMRLRGELPSGEMSDRVMRSALENCPPEDPYHTDVLSSNACLSWAHYNSSGNSADLDQAIKYRDEELNMRPLDDPDRAQALGDMAMALERRFRDRTPTHSDGLQFADLELAIKYRKDALELHLRGHLSRANSLSNLAKTLAINPRYLSNAEQCHREAIRLDFTGSALIDFAGTLLFRFKCGKDSGDLELAFQHLRLAQMQLKAHDPRLHRVYLTFARAYDLQFQRYHNDIDQARVFYYYGQAANHITSDLKKRLEASEMWIDSAKRYSNRTGSMAGYKAALSLLDQHVILGHTLADRHTLLKETLPSLGPDAAACAMECEQLETAVEVLEQGRGILLAQQARFMTPLQELWDVDKMLAKRFTSLSQQLAQGVASGSGEDAGRNEIKYITASEEWNTVVEEVQQMDKFSDFLRPLSYAHLRTAAQIGPVIIVNTTTHRADALVVISTGRPIHIPLNFDLKLVDKLLSDLSTVFENLADDSEDARQDRRKRLILILRELWDFVVEPIVRCLEQHKIPRHSRIWWCPTAQLSHLPLHAAGPYKKKKDNLPDLYISSYTPTLSALIRARKDPGLNNPAGPSLLLIGQRDPGGQSRETELKNVDEEARQIVDLIPKTMPHRLLTGLDATRELAISLLDDYNWVHFACHGKRDLKQPFESSFVLCDGAHLSLVDIIGSNAKRGEFAFLSACYTAQGNKDTPDETIHLANALQFSGFRSVVGTMWAMDDRDGLTVVQEFYKNILSRGTVDFTNAAEALQEATKSQKIPLDRRVVFIHIGA